MSFSQIDKFLNRYQEFMQKTGLGPNSIYLYLRTLRALINKAIEENYAP
ncbi:MAG: phage integrase SAM-like domain-containing protein [Bacteroidetes bacterium]|nr:phage integrase SAM-like domain-containing protein [Bacteroidota bacterium]